MLEDVNVADLTMPTQKIYNKLQINPNNTFIMDKMIDYLFAVKHM